MHHPRAPSDRNIDKIAQNVTGFEHRPGGKNDTNVHLKDIEFYLSTVPDATVDDRILLEGPLIRKSTNSLIKLAPPTNGKAAKIITIRNLVDASREITAPVKDDTKTPPIRNKQGKTAIPMVSRNQSGMNKKDLDAIKRVMEQVHKEEKEKVDLVSAPSAP